MNKEKLLSWMKDMRQFNDSGYEHNKDNPNEFFKGYSLGAYGILSILIESIESGEFDEEEE